MAGDENDETEVLRQRIVLLESDLRAAWEEISAINANLQDETSKAARAEEFLAITEAIIVALEPDGTVAMINRKGCDLLGYSEDEIIGESWLEIVVPEEQRDTVTATFRKVIAGEIEPVRHYENEILTKSGERRLVSWHNSTVRGGDGAILGSLSSGQDITERKQAEEALRGSEEQHRALYEKTPAMGHSIDQEGRLVSVTDTWLETLGYSRDEVIGRKSTSFLTEASRRIANEIALPEFFRTGAIKDTPYQFVKKNGEIIDVILSAVTERDAKGNFPRSFAIFTDVTAQKRAEEALLESEGRLRTVMDNVPASIWLKDTDGRFLLANKKFEEWNDITIEEAVGKAAYDLWSKELADTITALDQKVMDSGESCESEVDLTVGKNSPDSILTIRFPVLGDDGVLLGSGGVNFDITERKRVEEALQESEAQAQRIYDRLDDAIESFSDGFVLFDADDRFVLCNTAYQNAHPKVAEIQVPGKEFDTITRDLAEVGFYGNRAEEIEECVRLRLERHRRGEAFEYRMEDGRWFQMNEFKTHDGGTALVRIDITERKRAEEALRESEQQAAKAHQRLVQAIEAMADGFSLYDHDDRLVLCNHRYREIFPIIADLLVPGVSFEETCRAYATSGHVPKAKGREEEWIQERLEMHRNPKQPRLLLTHDGRWIQISERRTSDGGYLGIRTDITDMILREQTLKESEEQFRQLAENIDEVFWLGSSDWRQIHYISPGYEEVWGRSCESLYENPMTWGEAIHPEDREAVNANLAIKVTGDLSDPSFPEYRIVRPDGTIRWILARAFPIRDDHDAVVKIAGIAEDITERKRAEEELRLSEERFRNLIEGSLEGILIHKDFKPLFANQSCVDMFGYGSIEEVVKLSSVLDLVSPSYRDLTQQRGIDRVRGGNPTNRYEVQCLRKDGSVIWIDLMARAIDWSGETAIQLTTIDITERKQVEDALRQSESFNKSIMDNLPIGLAVNSVDPTVDFTYMNDNFPKFYRTDREALADPDSFWDAVYEDPTFREEIKTRVLDDCASGDQERMHWEDVPITRNGEGTFFINAKNIPIPEKKLMLSLVWDVTEHKQANEALREAKEQAEFANRSKTEFLANMSHELRTPLNSIIGFSEMLEGEFFGPLGSDKNREYVVDVKDAGSHLLRVISDILDVSKIEAGAMELSEEAVDIRETIDTCMTMMNERANLGAISLSTEVADDLPALFVDPTALKQILLNLLSNAVKFTPAGGHATTKAYLEGDGSSALEIIDTGIGIAAENVTKVLEPFAQIADITTRHHEGTGLGLSLAKSMAELHGGTLELVSEIGVGTTVTVRFPPERTVAG